MEAKYHIITDLPCRVLHFGKEICIATPGEDACIFLLKGKHVLSFVSTENIADTYRIVLEVPENDMESFIEVGLIPLRRLRMPPEAIDLGLPSGLKWGSFNLGAATPEEYGDYYAWGETEPKEDYSWSTYKWCNGTEHSLTKYNTSTRYGTVDNKTALEAEDDVAHVKLGGSWRMPTDAEWAELRDNCTWALRTQHGVEGGLVTSNKNGNSIFLPAAGCRNGTSPLCNTFSRGNYWSSSLDKSSFALNLQFSRGIVHAWADFDRYVEFRYLGLSVRPVYAE